jgi:hypothetical protein
MALEPISSPTRDFALRNTAGVSCLKNADSLSGPLFWVVVGKPIAQAGCHCCGKEQKRQNPAIVVVAGRTSGPAMNNLVT